MLQGHIKTWNAGEVIYVAGASNIKSRLLCKQRLTIDEPAAKKNMLKRVIRRFTVRSESVEREKSWTSTKYWIFAEEQVQEAVSGNVNELYKTPMSPSELEVIGQSMRHTF